MQYLKKRLLLQINNNIKIVIFAGLKEKGKQYHYIYWPFF
jgi:hypothetical protein